MDNIKDLICKVLLEQAGATGVRIMDGDVLAVVSAGRIRITVERQ